MNAPGNGAGPHRRRRIRTRMTPPPPPDFCRVPPAGNPAAATRSVASIRVDRQPAGRPARTAAAAGRRLPGRPAEPRSRRPAGIYPSDERPHAPPSRAGPRRPAEGPLPSPPRRVGKSRENLAGISRDLGRGGGGPFPRRRRVAARGEGGGEGRGFARLRPSLARDRAKLGHEPVRVRDFPPPAGNRETSLRRRLLQPPHGVASLRLLQKCLRFVCVTRKK